MLCINTLTLINDVFGAALMIAEVNTVPYFGGVVQFGGECTCTLGVLSDCGERLAII